MPICTVAVTCARTKVEQKEIRSNRYQTLPLVEKICAIFFVVIDFVRPLFTSSALLLRLTTAAAAILLLLLLVTFILLVDARRYCVMTWMIVVSLWISSILLSHPVLRLRGRQQHDQALFIHAVYQ